MSRFFLITTQTKEFPMILVMISTDVTTVTAISADSGMTMSVLVTITESIIYKKNEYIFRCRSIQNPLHEKEDHW